MSKLSEQLALLYEVQKIDQQVQILDKKKEQIPKGMKILDIQFGKHEEKLEAKRLELEEIKKKQRSLNGQLKLQKDQLAKYQEQLRSVKDNKQYRALAAEIDTIEIKRLEFEEEVLKSMVEADDIEAEFKSYEKELNKLKANYEAKKVELKKTVDEIDKTIAKLKKEQKPFYPKIDNDLLQKYNNWRKKGLFLLSVVKGNVCSGCNLTIPQQTINEVNKNEKIVTCGSCGRILYIP